MIVCVVIDLLFQNVRKKERKKDGWGFRSMWGFFVCFNSGVFIKPAEHREFSAQHLTSTRGAD